MPEIKNESQPEEDITQEQEGISEQELEQILSEFEAKIESGEWSGKPFHSVVKEQLYPLIGAGTLELEQFAKIIQQWANKNYPHDWPSREFIFKESSQN